LSPTVSDFGKNSRIPVMSDHILSTIEASGEDEEPGESGTATKKKPTLTDLPEELLLYLVKML